MPVRHPGMQGSNEGTSLFSVADQLLNVLSGDGTSSACFHSLTSGTIWPPSITLPLWSPVSQSQSISMAVAWWLSPYYPENSSTVFVVKSEQDVQVTLCHSVTFLVWYSLSLVLMLYRESFQHTLVQQQDVIEDAVVVVTVCPHRCVGEYFQGRQILLSSVGFLHSMWQVCHIQHHQLGFLLTNLWAYLLCTGATTSFPTCTGVCAGEKRGRLQSFAKKSNADMYQLCSRQFGGFDST